MKDEKGVEGQLRVWNVINPPRPARHFDVKNVKEAIKVINREAQIQLKDKDVESNAFGLQVYEEKYGGCEYYDEDDRDINEIMKGE